MKAFAPTLAVIGAVAVAAALPARAEEALGAGITMYFQMGGNPGDGSTLPRTNGARAAAAAYGVKLVEQYSGWQPEKMLNQFKEALAASPGCLGGGRREARHRRHLGQFPADQA
jgi:simple sugar transport system substrate-binding protein